MYIETLKKINWDFENDSTNGDTHSIHPYPAKFIPQIPRPFIETLTTNGETVYDPFLGSGTTAVEANILGRNAIGNDVNELAVLISKVKTTPIPDKKLQLLDNLLEEISKRVIRFYSKKKENINYPDIVNIDLWFEKFVINELVIIKEEINKIKDKDLKDLCLVALSAIIINVSKQDSDTRYVRVKKNIKPTDTFCKYSKQLSKLKKIISLSSDLLKKGQAKFKVADTRKEGIFNENSAHLAITSPPYPNAYDYHLYHKYRLLWLGMNPKELRKKEIGAHADYSKKNGPDEFDFMKDMEKCFLNTSKILNKNSYFVLIIGNSILKGRTIHNNEVLKQSALKTPFRYIDEFSRTLKLTKKSFNPVIGNIKTEKILIFENLK